MIETWTDIPGYSGKYQIDKEANVRRIYASGRTWALTPYHRKMSGSQRMVVKLTKDGHSREEVLMNLVARTFLGMPPKGYVPYHKNGRKIFEGDIVKINDDVKEAFGISDGAVIYRGGSFIIGDNNGNGTLNSLFAVTDINYVLRGEVVGNIFDNPELMEGVAS